MDGTYPETYFCIDQKSFYASVECVERQLDPMTALLVVADAERSNLSFIMYQCLNGFREPTTWQYDTMSSTWSVISTTRFMSL